MRDSTEHASQDQKGEIFILIEPCLSWEGTFPDYKQ